MRIFNFNVLCHVTVNFCTEIELKNMLFIVENEEKFRKGLFNDIRLRLVKTFSLDETVKMDYVDKSSIGIFFIRLKDGFNTKRFYILDKPNIEKINQKMIFDVCVLIEESFLNFKMMKAIQKINSHKHFIFIPYESEKE